MAISEDYIKKLLIRSGRIAQPSCTQFTDDMKITISIENMTDKQLLRLKEFMEALVDTKESQEAFKITLSPTLEESEVMFSDIAQPDENI